MYIVQGKLLDGGWISIRCPFAPAIGMFLVSILALIGFQPSTFAEVYFLAVAGLEEKQVFMDNLELFNLDSVVSSGHPTIRNKWR